MSRSNTNEPSPTRPDSSASARVSQTGDQTPAGQAPIAPVSLSTTAERVPQRPAATRADDTTTLVAAAPKNAAPASKSARDVFRISIVTQSPMRVGDTATLRANIDHTSGNGPTPRITWISNKPGVVRVDPITGGATALAEGQAVVRAIGGGARADAFVSVFAAAPRTTAAVATAPVPEPARSAPPPVPEPARSAPPPAPVDNSRSRAADGLRESANNMVAALKSKDGAVVTRLFGDGNNADAADLLKTMKDQFGFSASVVQIDQPQIVDRSGTIDYRLTVSWVSAAGLTRTRNLDMRAESEQRGDAWTVVRHRIVSGWR